MSILYCSNLQPPNVNKPAQHINTQLDGCPHLGSVWSGELERRRANGCWREGPSLLHADASMLGMAQFPAIEDPPCFLLHSSAGSAGSAGSACSSTQSIRDIGTRGALALLRVPSIPLDARLVPKGQPRRLTSAFCFVCNCYCLLNGPHKMVLESASATRVMHRGTAAAFGAGPPSGQQLAFQSRCF